MKPLHTFEEFLLSGIVHKKSPNLARATSLQNDARKRKRFLNEVQENIGIKDGNANYIIENVYDTIMALTRAKMLQQGYSASGEGAHAAEIAFLRTKNITEPNIRLLNELRYHRNGILYYGKNFDKEYAEKTIQLLSKMFSVLLKK